MQQQFDSRELMARAGEVAKEIRKSEAYPALIGGIAGGLAGAVIAAIVAGRASGKGSEASDSKEKRKSWAVRDVVELVTVGTALAKQVQAWMKEREEK